MYTKEMGIENDVDDFRKNCPNVSSLSIAENGKSWVHKFGRQLETLQICSGCAAPIYSTVAALSELTLGCLDVKRSADFWQRIGRSLKSLTVCAPISGVSKVYNIKEHCRYLEIIHLHGSGRKEVAAIASILTSYGDQLEFASLYNMKESQLRIVAGACPNARFRLYNLKNSLSYAGLNSIGHRLEVIFIFELLYSKNLVEWTKAWGKCKNLRELYIVGCNKKVLETIFAAVKEQLIVLRIANRDLDAKEVLDICTKGTIRVEDFIFEVHGFCRESYAKFFDANRASLSYVSVRYHYGASRDWDKLVGSFLKFPALKELYLDYEIPEYALKSLVNRGVYWKKTGVLARLLAMHHAAKQG